MSAYSKLFMAGAIGAAAGWAGLSAGGKGWTPARLGDEAQMFLAAMIGTDAKAMPAPVPPASGSVIYYRHPDDTPAWSAGPTSTADGRPYIAVLASQDVSFEPVTKDNAAREPPPTVQWGFHLQSDLLETHGQCS